MPLPSSQSIVGRRCKRCATIEPYGPNYYGVPTDKCPLFADILGHRDYHDWESVWLIPDDMLIALREEVALASEQGRMVGTMADHYREALEEAQRRLEWVARDRREPDKVLVNVASVGGVIQRALNA